MKVDVHEAEHHFAHLLARAAAGEEIVICEAGRPVARLIPYKRKAVERVPGLDRGKVWIADDFDAPLPPDVGKLFG
ncbi:MAG TPA: type II toxin-antitoxin system Phd/YefM family antitoxin [Vicinamibacteria bacterium]|jgi:prevent-host-death family protein